ncbi:MAG: CYTH domain-containing protein [Deltaproteobacteria bacterium]|nr:CYTH domain-containing protein [Deltaproteobacteria bacterium]
MEKEFKYRINKTQYQKLLLLSDQSTHQLDNYFFDTPTLSLHRHKLGLRLRITDNTQATITLKYPAASPEPGIRGYKVREEIECGLSLNIARTIIKKTISIIDLRSNPLLTLKAKLPQKELTDIRLLGSIQTTRTVITPAKNLTVELDRTRIFHKTFYEVEVETTTPRRTAKALVAFLKAQNIQAYPFERSKLDRFIAEWKRKRALG